MHVFLGSRYFPSVKVRFEGTATKTMLNRQVLQRFRDEPSIELVGTKLHVTEDK
ncbi:MAG: hypothetical protein L0I66_04155 [Tetragenococcus halophilus]|uniref:Uncharacterized protein n=1 Tax=Tetragenococcus halophilus (strain DSM 20338 / JCM 20259 / NCIMB 9735 / NBRC 12172) TaxID=945021 RepID=A0AAN1SHT1_TETHN|nr:hypothetical protein [Tetragenococcus halophilus]BAK95245.1 hypothetical protein TEH_19180 [Tetragenococcus halophilus NBRC 12172]MCO8289885.1 hypothetical protein [Tetragenococcus halophilus]MCO8293750.1 hypothetical protein [Tetragenococcus halophilus]MDN6127563.1 hypothetical protein [Tetragenococcus halophilus]MDN6129766.1 hypothetical protein [Tetragenococcus halophilus]